MEDSVKKPLMVVIIVACLALAIFITYKTQFKEEGIPEELAKEPMWVKCRNPECEGEYEVNKGYYYEYIEENRVSMAVPPLVCEQCGEGSVYKAIKCSNSECGIIFEAWSAGMGDYEDRCPKCGISGLEEEAKAIKERMKARKAGGK